MCCEKLRGLGPYFTSSKKAPIGRRAHIESPRLNGAGLDPSPAQAGATSCDQRVPYRCVLRLWWDEDDEPVASTREQDSVGVEPDLQRILDVILGTAVPVVLSPPKVLTPSDDGHVEFKSLALELRCGVSK